MCAQKYIVYPRLSEDMVNQAATALTDPTSIKFFGICAESCPPSLSWICTDEYNTTETNYGSEKHLNDCKGAAGGGQFLSKFAFAGNSAQANCSILMQNCYQLPFGSTDILFRCLYQYNSTTIAGEKMCTDPPNLKASDDKCVKTSQMSITAKEEPAKEDLVAKQMATATAMFTTYVADVIKAGPTILLVGGLGAAAFGFVWLILLRYLAGCFVWLAIWLLFIVLLASSLYSFTKAGIINVADAAAASGITVSGSTLTTGYGGLGASNDDADKEMFTYIAYILAAVTFVYVTVILLMRKNIKIAVAIIKETSKAVAHMPLVMAFPLTTLVAVIAMFGFWLWTFGNCYTMGAIVASDLTSTASDVVATGDNYTSSISGYENSPVRDYVLWYLVFALFWMNNFIQVRQEDMLGHRTCFIFLFFFFFSHNPHNPQVDNFF